jgi:hypothetical protein
MADQKPNRVGERRDANASQALEQAKPMHNAYIKPLHLRRTFGEYCPFTSPKFFIHKDKLNKRELVLKRASGAILLHLTNISPGLKSAIYKMSKNDKITNEDKDTLSADDIKSINTIAMLIRSPTDVNDNPIIYKKSGPRKPNNHDIMRRIQVLTDEIDSGNDGYEVKQELKRFVACAAIKHLIPAATENDIINHYKL